MNILNLIKKECEGEPHLIKDMVIAFRENYFQKIILPESLQFDEDVKELEVLSQAYKDELLSSEVNNLKKEDLDKFIHKVIFISHHLIFFPDETILNRLKELGFPKTVTRWFIPIHQFKIEFERINQSESILIRPNLWISNIHQHLLMNLINEVYLWADKMGKKRSGSYYNDSHNKLYDSLRAKKYYAKRNKNLKGANFTMQLSPLINEVFEYIPEKEAEKMILQFAQGKTEKYTLAFAFSECSFHFSNGQKPYIVTWNLFKLLMPNRNFMDQDTFIKSDQFETYERNYNRYCYYALKKIVPLTKIDDD